MTVAATITRQLNIRYIDARKLETTAKLNLGITNYPNYSQAKGLIKEIKRIFYDELSLNDRKAMRINNENLVSAKKKKKPAAKNSPSSAQEEFDQSFSTVSTIHSSTSLSSTATHILTSPITCRRVRRTGEETCSQTRGSTNTRASRKAGSLSRKRRNRLGARSVAQNVKLFIPQVDDQNDILLSQSERTTRVSVLPFAHNDWDNNEDSSSVSLSLSSSIHSRNGSNHKGLQRFILSR